LIPFTRDWIYDHHHPPTERVAEEAFDQLNPDFGVPADQHNADGRQAVSDREVALTLGVRVAVHDARQNDRDPVVWQRGQDYRAADAIHAAAENSPGPVVARSGSAPNANQHEQGVEEMAADNHTTIVGNLVEDPEVRFTHTGIAVANLLVAVTQRIQQDGEWRDGDTSFLRVNVWRGQAEHLADSLGKGDRVMVTGQLRQRSWETPEGDKRSVTEIEADEVGASLKWATAKVERAPERKSSDRSCLRWAPRNVVPGDVAVSLPDLTIRPGRARRASASRPVHAAAMS
jgi:single-strand DNA-binding protein